MSRIASLPVLFFFLLFCVNLPAPAGITNFTDRGKADFDTAMLLLNPYGAWSRLGGQWAYTPLDREAPYANGRWLYTEYGWYWQGNRPHSWATEHYGYWKRNADHVWSWYPGPYWLPQIVELRTTSTHIGWRSGPVDRDGNFVETPEERYAKTDEWTFVTLAQFAGPITPDIVAKPEVAKTLLDDTTECRHTYVTYREIDRPGPHPADFLALCKDDGMFAPLTLQDQATPPPSTLASASTHQTAAPAAATNANTNTVPPLVLNGAPDPQTATNARRVKYWITMSLPTYWTPRPPDAKPEEVYLYRPDFYQDEDGIARRIALWLNPNSRKETARSLSELLGGGVSSSKAPPDIVGKPDATAIPATPAAPQKTPFQSPFDAPFHPGDDPRTPSASTKAASTGLVPPPVGTNAQNAPIPPPIVTNSAPNQ